MLELLHVRIFKLTAVTESIPPEDETLQSDP
jgi:hypothetical protein